MITVILLLSLCGQLWALDGVITEDTKAVRSILAGLGEAERLVRPHQNTTVKLGLALTSLIDMDEEAGTLTAIYFIQMTWNDPRLQWGSGSQQTSTTLRIPISTMWRPDLKLWDNLDAKESIDDSVFPVVYRDGTVLWIPPAKLITRCEKEDGDDEDEDDKKVRWTCPLKFGMWTYNGWEVVLKLYNNVTTVDMVNLSKITKVKNWDVSSPKKDGAEVTATYFDCCPDPYPHADFTIKMSRDATSGSSLAVASSLLLVLTALL